MANQQDTNLYHIERGQRATTVKAVILPYVSEKIDAAVSHMVAVYRSGDIRHDILIGKVGEISVLMAILAELEVIEGKADRVRGKEIGNAPPKE